MIHSDTGLCMRLLEGNYAICQLCSGSSIPEWALGGQWASFTMSPRELSLVCLEERVPQGVICQRGWRVLELQGPVDPNSVGVISRISSALAEASIPLCVISAYETDYFLIRDEDLGRAMEVLEGKGSRIGGRSRCGRDR
ncbi:MAG: ACT domain-containing protein [bacterium]